MDPLQSGEMRRYYCDECQTEFEVRLKPKAKKANETPAKKVTYCPFCGYVDVEEA